MAHEHQEVAEEVAKLVRDKPDMSVQDLAAALAEHEVDERTIITVLDEFRHDDGNVVHVGPGRGGGWVPAQTADEEG